ncbi:OB-fold domain-containing protein [Mesorhizobium atlanticum]
MHKPGHPGWLPAAPYVVGLIELAEGPTMLSLILPGTQPLQVGGHASACADRHRRSRPTCLQTSGTRSRGEA